MSIIKKKWFGRTVMLALACLMFLGLKDRVAAKADDPEASARLIYANHLDTDGNPYNDTDYSFNNGGGWLPYAIYITPASGSAITLDPDTFPNNVDFGSIRIWNNNCQVRIDPSRDIDMLRLVQTGPDSWLESDRNRYNRGGCEANIYNSENTATEIADYFNNFVHGYWNDLTVTFSHNENDGDNTTIYNISWDMSANHLIIENKVGVVLQDGQDDQGHPTEGMISVYNTLTVGADSFIDSIDNKPRLMISEDCTTVTGMDIYDYYGSTGETRLMPGSFGGLYYITDAEIEGNNIRIWTKYHAAVPTDAVGNAGVTTSAKKFIYAYAPLDYDFDNDVDDDDIRYALAAELAYKLRGGPGDFGLSDIDYGSLPMEDVWDSLAGNTTTSDAAILRNRITLMPAGSKTVINAEGNEEVRDRYIATIDWGYTSAGALISGTVYVYKLDLPEELLICTDFDEITGDGQTFYVRKGFGDKRVLIGDADYYNDPNYESEERWREVHEDYFSTVITTASFSNIVAGGHGVSMYVKNKDSNLFTFQTISYCQMKFKDQGAPQTLTPDLFVKIFKTSGKFFATRSEGEAKRYDFVSHDATGNSADKFWEAGGQYPVKLFIHDNILHIMPLNANSGVDKALNKVTLTDSIPAAAVTINNTNKADIVITFNSNFYDTVSFELEYADGSKGAFTVEREGIIIQYGGLNDTGYGRYWLDIYGEGVGNELNYSYDFDEEDFVVMATYYHSSAETGNSNLSLIVTYDDGSTEVISSVDTAHNFSGYKSGAGYVTDGEGHTIPAAVDTTTFIVGFSKIDWINRNFTFSKDGHTGGFSVQVVNAGFDNADSFGGAMAGSGKGKYWDGDFSHMYP